jgi:hypothetical protein
MEFAWYRLKKNWMSLLALLISLGSLLLNIGNYTADKRLAHLHMEPTVKCLFDFPDDGNPVFLVTNNGDIPAVSLSIAHSVYVFDRTTLDLATVAQSGNLFSDNVIYREELRPTEYASLELVRVDPVDRLIAVYLFDLRYYRESDMQSYDRQEIFYVDSGQVYSQSEFIRTATYRPIMEGIEQFQMPLIQYDPGSLRELLELLEAD